MTKTKTKPVSKRLFANVNARAERKQLPEIGLDQYVELPQIAVMGDPSSGKSSLLSALSGVSFPSADQLTTRCPTQLILTNADTFRGNVRLVRFRPDGHHSVDEGSESTTESDEAKESLSCLDDVPNAITKLTQKLVDEGQYISDDQIVIEMSGPELPNLTLTDLPGLVRTVGDHEDQCIIPRVRTMVDRYMTQERTVIIAVVPANVDMHNTEILQAAQEADPNGTRTVAVVTKVDLVDAGAEQAVHDLLLNKKKEMHLGYHAVKCRSQRELTKGTTIEKGILNESAFFGKHEYWRRLPKELWGVSVLTERLVSILQDNIRRSLPKVITEINARMVETEKELLSLGTPFEYLGAQRQQLGKWVNQYLRHMEAAMNGQYEQLSTSCGSSLSGQSNDLRKEDNQQASQAVTNIRLRAVIREKEDAFRVDIAGMEQPKAQEDVEVGDAVQILIDGQWQSQHVKDVKGTDIRCDGFDCPFFGFWKSKDSWRFDKIAMMKQFIREKKSWR